MPAEAVRITVQHSPAPMDFPHHQQIDSLDMKSLPILFLLACLSSIPTAWSMPQCSYGVESGGACVPPQDAGYGANQSNPQQEQAQQAPPAHWETRWGAIATDGPGGHLGTAVNMTSKEQAEQASLTECQTKGGTQCKIEISYYNQCAAMVVGDTEHSTARATTIGQAVQLGIKTCNNAGDTNCRAYYTGCSQPVRIQ